MQYALSMQCNDRLYGCCMCSRSKYRDSSRLYDSPVSICAGVELWSGKVPVDEGKCSSIVGVSPLHPDEVAGQNSKTSLPRLYNRARVWLRVIPEGSRNHESLKEYKDYNPEHRSVLHHINTDALSVQLMICCEPYKPHPQSNAIDIQSHKYS